MKKKNITQEMYSNQLAYINAKALNELIDMVKDEEKPSVMFKFTFLVEKVNEASSNQRFYAKYFESMSIEEIDIEFERQYTKSLKKN